MDSPHRSVDSPQVLERMPERAGLSLCRFDRKRSFVAPVARSGRSPHIAFPSGSSDWKTATCNACYGTTISTRKPKTKMRRRPPRGVPRIMKEHPQAHGMTLFELAIKYRYTCVRCGGKRQSAHIAIDGNDWKELVCRSCYDDAQTGNPPKKDPLERLVPRVASFLRAANVQIDYEAGWVVVCDKRAFRAAGLKQRLDARDWDDLIDRVVFADCPDVLVEAMRARRGPGSIETRPSPPRDQFFWCLSLRDHA